MLTRDQRKLSGTQEYSQYKQNRDISNSFFLEVSATVMVDYYIFPIFISADPIIRDGSKCNSGEVDKVDCRTVSFYTKVLHETVDAGDTMSIYGQTRVWINGGWVEFFSHFHSCSNVPRSQTVYSKTDEAGDWCAPDGVPLTRYLMLE